jgi:signal transduction histidine kinase
MHAPPARSLTWKLGLAFFVVSITGALVAAVFFWLTTQNAFQNAAFAHAESDFAAQMAAYYEDHSSWNGVADYARSLSPPNQASGTDALPSQPHVLPFVLVDQHGRVVVPGPTMHEGQQLPASAYAHDVAVRVSGHIVGTVLMDGGPPPLSRIDSLFLASTERALILGALASVAIALALGIVLTRSLTHPVRELTSAIHAMAGGELQQTVPVRSRDELGELTAAFNKMSTDLALANTQRRQMTADIAHDLRTPVTVIAGYLEALRDGVLPPSPERFSILSEEARHLQDLIEDLRTLSLADAGELALHLEPIAPHALLERIAATYSHQAEQRGITLVAAASENLPSLLVDVTRMVQVLGNLVGNALRYTPSGGTITLSAEAAPQGTLLRVSDTGEGIRPEALSRIFDRFYRADAARSQSQGESGLGLAIARALVEAHGGTIRAESERGHGATFAILMPSAAESAAS